MGVVGGGTDVVRRVVVVVVVLGVHIQQAPLPSMS